jgi:hypothetical protein
MHLLQTSVKTLDNGALYFGGVRHEMLFPDASSRLKNSIPFSNYILNGFLFLNKYFKTAFD